MAQKVPPEKIDEYGLKTMRSAASRTATAPIYRLGLPDLRWPGRSKESATILDAIADELPDIEDRATLYSSTEFKGRLYFTDVLATGNANTPTSAFTGMPGSLTIRAALYARARDVLPGG
jgi:hypothetical protein